MTKKIIVVVCVAIAIVGCVYFSLQHKDQLRHDPSKPNLVSPVAKVSVRLPIPIIEAGATPFYVAVDQGFYAQEGLDVSLEMGSRELNPVKMVASGTDTFGVLGGPDTVLVGRSKGQPLRSVLVLHRNSNFPVVITLETSHVTKVEELEGKKVGFFYGHISTDVLRNLFRKKNVRVEEVDVGFDYGQLVSGQVSACWGFRTTAGLDLPEKGIAIDMINPADAAGIVSHGYTVFATDETISTKPELVAKFVRATIRGIRFTVDSPNEALSSLLKRDPNLNADLSLKRLLLYNEVTSDSADFPPGYMDEAMFRQTYDRLVEEGVIETPFPVNEAFSTKFLEEAWARADQEQTKRKR